MAGLRAVPVSHVTRASDAPQNRAAAHRRSEIRHKTEVISVRVTPEQKAEIAAWAVAHGKTTSEALLFSFIVTTIVEAREQVAP